MSNQELIKLYNEIEAQRIELKEQWSNLTKSNSDKDKINQIGKKLTELTFNQAYILMDLEHK